MLFGKPNTTHSYVVIALGKASLQSYKIFAMLSFMQQKRYIP